MYEEYQIEIPASFLALFVDPGRQKPNAFRDVVAVRYELCEDMATMLTETAKNMLFSLGIAEQDVLVRCLGGLRGEGAVVTAPEAGWVVRRMAELLDWEQPNLGAQV
jgi:hypothetical protein